MAKKVTYTKKEKAIFYSKRFLKIFIPAVVAAVGTMGLAPESFIVATVVPLVTTFDKWARDNNWYKY